VITSVGTETPTGREMIETAQLYPRSCRNWSRNSSDDNPNSSPTFDESTVNDFTGTINKPDGVDTDSVKTITPKNGGTLSVNTSSGSKIDSSVPGGAVGSGECAQVSIKSVDPDNLPKPQPWVRLLARSSSVARWFRSPGTTRTVMRQTRRL